MVSYQNTQTKKDEQVHIILYPLVPSLCYIISTGASSRILRMEMFPGVFNTNLSCAVNKIETVRLVPLVILVMFEKTSVSFAIVGTEVRNQNLFRSLASGALNLLRVESVTLNQIVWEISNSHASQK